jgi:hypothetical protein
MNPLITIRAQKRLALALMDWHGGQASGLYAVGSCMLSGSYKGRRYVPTEILGHADNAEETGAVTRAISELRNLRKDANFPEKVTHMEERECNALANRLARHFCPERIRKETL